MENVHQIIKKHDKYVSRKESGNSDITTIRILLELMRNIRMIQHFLIIYGN